MSAWKGLLPAAMVGTERAAAWNLDMDGAVGELLRDIQQQAGTDPADRLLRSAAVLAACANAGVRGAPAAASAEAAPEDARPALADASIQQHLAWTFGHGPARLQHHALRRVAAQGWRLPSRLLPVALDLGRRSTALREPLQPALGERGRWLARHNTEWRYADGAAEDADVDALWAHGNPQQRRELLVRERAADPARARERLATELPQLSARERADFLGALATGLGADDEALLESLLADRSKEVRQAAAGLLVRLPDSAFVRHAGERLAPLLRQERGLIRQRWRIEAPTEADAQWERDGVDAARPKQESLGERAWWLYQLARQVPVSWWCARMDMTPAELFAWGAATDWAEALLRAWREVLLNTAEPEACEALLDGWPWKGLAGDPAQIAALLPAGLRETHWQRELGRGSAGLRTLLPQLLAGCPPGEILSPALSQRLAPVLREALNDPNIAFDYALRGALPELCCLLQPDALAALAATPHRADPTPAHAELLDALARIAAARRAFDQLPTASSSPSAP
ncbi:MAG: DUF5691 domain-containing protein [Pseudomonadota bacterium]